MRRAVGERRHRVHGRGILVQRNGDAVDRYPLPNANVLTLAGDMHHALTGLVINVMGFFGGFVLSAIKRDRGVKDWGSMIEGHGGMLDRVDSISFSAPIFFHIVRYWWT